MKLAANIGSFLGTASNGIDRFIATMNKYYEEKTKSSRDKKIAKDMSASLVFSHLVFPKGAEVTKLCAKRMINPFAYSPKAQTGATGNKRKVIKYLGRDKASSNGNRRTNHGKRLIPAINN